MSSQVLGSNHEVGRYTVDLDIVVDVVVVYNSIILAYMPLMAHLRLMEN